VVRRIVRSLIARQIGPPGLASVGGDHMVPASFAGPSVDRSKAIVWGARAGNETVRIGDMQRRRLGHLEVSAIGLGCATMTPFYGVPDPQSGIATIRRAAELGIDFLDSSDAYGAGRNEELIARAVEGRRGDYVIASKFGNLGMAGGSRFSDGRPEYLREACERSLKRLATDAIDLYYIHRVDPSVPIEDTVGAMSDLVRQGKVRHLGICEAGPATIRRAHATHSLSAVQIEYSLWTRDVEAEILPLCEELGIGFVAYSPLGRGFLTGTVASPADLRDGDARRGMPRFQGDNLRRNLALVEELKGHAAAERCTPAQLALAWLLARRRFIVPIAGTSHSRWLEENAAAAGLTISADTMDALDHVFAPGAAVGARYPEGHLARLMI
jgi:aryl-alcohol dehydrogenase-like predicted oxidoreductase